MDKREFDVNSYHMVVKLNTGPGPYLYRLDGGREGMAESGDYLIYEGDKIIGHLPPHVIDLMAIDVHELYTLERVKEVSDQRSVSEFFEIEVGPGERFDGERVLDGSGKPIGETLEMRIQRLPSTDDLRPDGEVKDLQDRENDAKGKELLLSHPANRFSSAQARAAKEVADLERSEVDKNDELKEEFEVAKDRKDEREGKLNAVRERMGNFRNQRTGPGLEGLGGTGNFAETVDERKNRLARQDAVGKGANQTTNQGALSPEEMAALDKSFPNPNKPVTS